MIFPTPLNCMVSRLTVLLLFIARLVCATSDDFAEESCSRPNVASFTLDESSVRGSASGIVMLQTGSKRPLFDTARNPSPREDGVTLSEEATENKQASVVQAGATDDHISKQVMASSATHPVSFIQHNSMSPTATLVQVAKRELPVEDTNEDERAKMNKSELSLSLSLLMLASEGSPTNDSKHVRSAQQEPRKLLFVGYLSAPSNVDRRKKVREKCFPAIKAAGYDAKFFIGRPNENGPVLSHQGQRSTQMEADTARQLQDESDRWGDIAIVPFRDAYRDLTDKVAFMFRYALQEGAENVLKIDDDWCPDMSVVVPECKKTIPSQARYIGQYLFRGDESEIMIGRDGTVAKFMTGVGFILSAKLARVVFFDDIVHTLLFAPYGTSSDDANVGKWYDYAVKKHPGLNFSEEVVPGLVLPID